MNSNSKIERMVWRYRVNGLILCKLVLVTLGWYVISGTSTVQAQQANRVSRVNNGLVLLYDFSNLDNGQFQDRSGLNPSVPLKMENKGSIRHADDAVEFLKNGSLKSPKIAPRVAAAIIRSGEVTIEAWLHPSDLKQKGPARIFTNSRSTVDRSFTFGQEGDTYDFRVRSTRTDNNGIPSLSTKPGTARKSLTHVVYTRDRAGRARIYIDGKLNVEKVIPGALTNWTADFKIGVGNEIDGKRPWLGKIHLLAVYQRDLLPREVRQNFDAGVNAKSAPANKAASSSDLFTSKVAPIIAEHCLECHDAANKDGGLDLSSQKSAFAGSDSGKSILPGNPYDSAFWTQVVANEMPQDREPLTAKQKQILKDWIDQGQSGQAVTLIQHSKRFPQNPNMFGFVD